MDDAEILQELTDALRGKTIERVTLTKSDDPEGYIDGVQLAFTDGSRVHLNAMRWFDWILVPAMEV